jgi:5-methylcytosine-specific restriction protein A
MEPAYLITWKPLSENKEKGWPEESLKKLYDQLRVSGGALEAWRFSRQKGVQPGQRVYLVRQGRKGHALLGFGHVTEANEPIGGGTTLISFEALVNPMSNKVFATQDELHAITSRPGIWNTQASGILLPPNVAVALAELAKRATPIDDQQSTTTSNPDWARDELILALDLYFREPTARGSKTHPACATLSAVLNSLPIHLGKLKGPTFRNPNGVAMKLSNFLKYDPSYSGKGLPAGSHAEEEVWESFAEDLPKLRSTAMSILAGAEELTKSGIEANEEDEGAEEGRILTRIHKMRERDSSLAKKKKNKVKESTGGLECEVCNFDFALTFGALGVDFAECHHGKPISTLQPGEKTKLSDLHIVCANCHRMLHRGKQWLSVAELKKVRIPR